MERVRSAGFKLQVAISLCIYLGLFFLEYPPIFMVGYWSWGALVHKTLSGVLIALNLVITQYAVRRMGYFKGEAAALEPARRAPD